MTDFYLQVEIQIELILQSEVKIGLLCMTLSHRPLLQLNDEAINIQ